MGEGICVSGITPHAQLSSVTVTAIASDTLDFVVQAARDAHPNEFAAQLRARPAEEVGVDRDGKVFTEVLMIPGTTTTPISASTPAHAIPLGSRKDGSVHSHPNGVAKPSTTDMQNFTGDGVHIIIAAPYTRSSWQAWTADGEEVSLDVVDANLPDYEEAL